MGPCICVQPSDYRGTSLSGYVFVFPSSQPLTRESGKEPMYGPLSLPVAVYTIALTFIIPAVRNKSRWDQVPSYPSLSFLPSHTGIVGMDYPPVKFCRIRVPKSQVSVCLPSISSTNTILPRFFYPFLLGGVPPLVSLFNSSVTDLLDDRRKEKEKKKAY